MRSCERRRREAHLGGGWGKIFETKDAKWCNLGLLMVKIKNQQTLIFPEILTNSYNLIIKKNKMKYVFTK